MGFNFERFFFRVESRRIFFWSGYSECYVCQIVVHTLSGVIEMVFPTHKSIFFSFFSVDTYSLFFSRSLASPLSCVPLSSSLHRLITYPRFIEHLFVINHLLIPRSAGHIGCVVVCFTSFYIFI